MPLSLPVAKRVREDGPKAARRIRRQKARDFFVSMSSPDSSETDRLRSHLAAGQVIPAMPLALHEDRTWSERHQRALVRYYLDAGAGGLAVGVHTTQFEIRDKKHDLFETVLRSSADEVASYRRSDDPFARIAGVCGATDQARREAGREQHDQRHLQHHEHAAGVAAELKRHLG